MAADPPLSSLVLVATSVADDLGYVAFADVSRVERATRSWPRVAIKSVPMADHVIAGATAHVARVVTSWLAEQATGRQA